MSFSAFRMDMSVIWSSTTQEVTKKMETTAGMSELKLQLMFNENLRKAHAAFLQCFRNHALVVDKEVTKKGIELTEKLEESYGEKLTALRKQAAESASLVLKHKEEVVYLNGLVLAQENLIAAAKHKYDLDKTQNMQEEIEELRCQLEASMQESAHKSFQLSCGEQLIEQLRAEVQEADGVLEAHIRQFEKEKAELERQSSEVRGELKKKREGYKEQLRELQSEFSGYKRDAEKEIEIQSLLNNRRSDALKALESERRRNAAARAKPTTRIGNPEEPPDERDYKPYNVLPAPGCMPSRVYRVDALGKDQAWKEYRGTTPRRQLGKTVFRTLPIPRSLEPGPPTTPVMPTVVLVEPKGR
eukprot:GEMP01022934.1.p1 GENE.GEMP01022934.1~~GEMP01022934.1.p1  ORF type:complete len:358 (+),score=85.09 GEMP01022934.1:228-1301(+)